MRRWVDKRDTLITFEARTRTQDPVFGTTIEGGWTEVGEEWANVEDVLSGQVERHGDTLNMARRPCRIRTAYRPDITSDMRVVVKGRTMQIVRGPAEIGRMEGLELVCEDWSTQGVQA